MSGINAALECTRETFGWTHSCTNLVSKTISISAASQGSQAQQQNAFVWGWRALCKHPCPSQLGSFAFYANDGTAGGEKECKHRKQVTALFSSCAPPELQPTGPKAGNAIALENTILKGWGWQARPFEKVPSHFLELMSWFAGAGGTSHAFPG